MEPTSASGFVKLEPNVKTAPVLIKPANWALFFTSKKDFKNIPVPFLEPDYYSY